MARRPSASSSDPLLSRKRTADLLRALRDVSRDVRVLKAKVTEAAERHESTRARATGRRRR
jgi:hypothetical protein